MSTKQNIRALVKEAGVVGAGGAGFPAHVKLDSQAEVVIANGAECEPLLESDRHLMLREPEKVIAGLKAAMKAVGAIQGILAIKGKHSDIIELVKPLIRKDDGIELFLLDNFYPAGDEHVLVYEATGRLVPAGGIPLQAGVVVCNVYTLAMVADALDKKPFTERYVTLTGEVNRPCVAKIPIGLSIGDAIDKIGLGVSVADYTVLAGGPMMGKVVEDLEMPVTKTTSGIIVLPADARMVELKKNNISEAVRRAKSVCCQCTFCTEMCPRFLLGHRLKPHEAMRLLSSLTHAGRPERLMNALLCSECGLCGYYSCTMGLKPNSVNTWIKGMLARDNIKQEPQQLKPSDVNPFRNDRKTPTQRLVARLGLDMYNMHLPFIEEELKAEKLTILLKQHVGAPSRPVVKAGDRVAAGSLLAQMPETGLGANIHSPVCGVVTEINEYAVKLLTAD